MQEKIAEEFVRTYYTAMEADRNQMLQFYTDKSIMSFEGEHSVGLKQIADKIESFGFKKIEHKLDNMDVHPSPLPDGILILATGECLLDNENKFKFSQVFHIVPNATGGFYCANDILRLFFN